MFFFAAASVANPGKVTKNNTEKIQKNVSLRPCHL
jgi:hypothetical protein